MLELDCEAEAAAIAARMASMVSRQLRRRGVVVALSGGVDSATCAGLAVRALGPARVFALLLPERDSDPQSELRGRAVAEALGLRWQVQDIAPTLEAIGCYRLRDEAIRTVFPDYGPQWKCKIAIGGGATGGINYFRLVVRSPQGEQRETRLPHRAYMQIVAATSFKQRVRKAIEYYHADRLHYAVVGTPNRLEYDQGFFVKNGDGASDLKPIAHLYKTQVYALARHLGLPPQVCSAAPSTDTYSLPQGQDEFYFALPYQQMDVALWSHNSGLPAAELARRLDIDEAQAAHIYADIESKRRASAYLHAPPLLVEPVTQVKEAA